MESLIRSICQREGLTASKIEALNGGQVNQVYRIDEAYVLRIGAREDAFQRLKSETELLQSLPAEIPVPKILAFGMQEDRVYQIQQFVPGQKLYAAWKHLLPAEQENITAELAVYMKILRSRVVPRFGYVYEDSYTSDSWREYLTAKFNRTLEEINAYSLRMAPGFVELASQYFDEHQRVLEDSAPILVHGDLQFMNIMVDQGKISALYDFEYAMHAPGDYELRAIEDFCLHPNDYAEEEDADYCTADFAGFFPLLKKHDPDLFDTPNLRERMNLYHLEATLASYVAWRKTSLHEKPAEVMAAKGFYMTRITNCVFRHGIRLF